MIVDNFQRKIQKNECSSVFQDRFSENYFNKTMRIEFCNYSKIANDIT